MMRSDTIIWWILCLAFGFCIVDTFKNPTIDNVVCESALLIAIIYFFIKDINKT
jgi:hypothetical protein